MLQSEFKFQSFYYIHFQTNTLEKGSEPPTAMGKIVSLQFFNKDGFGIK